MVEPNEYAALAVRLMKSASLGRTLPAELYTSELVLEVEWDRIFSSEWMLGCHASELPDIGSFLVVAAGRDEVVLVRDEDRGISAFANVCRHRGGRLCLDRRGSAAGGIVCPYHGWVYALNGTLRSARDMPQGFDPSKQSLHRLKTIEWEGLVFLSSGGDSDDLAQSLRDVLPIVTRYGLSNARVAASRRWTVHANWKLLVENFEECYHCLAIHPQYSRVMPHARAEATGLPSVRADFQRLQTAFDEALRRREIPTGPIESGPRGRHWCARLPLRDGFPTQALRGELIAPLLGSISESDNGTMSLRLRPSNYVVASCDHAVLFSFLPRRAAETEVVVKWLVRADAREQVDYDPDEVVELWTMTTEQDNAMIEQNQLGVATAAYRPGWYSESESFCVIFHEWYFSKLGIPIPRATSPEILD